MIREEKKDYNTINATSRQDYNILNNNNKNPIKNYT
jgi:hypothetical protein